jgi:hypothetical protein
VRVLTQRRKEAEAQKPADEACLFCAALRSVRNIVRRKDHPHEIGSPEDMQNFASGEAKVRHQETLQNRSAGFRPGVFLEK